MKRDAHFGITLPKELHGKFQYLSGYEGRSMSRYMLYLMRQEVRRFEAEHGPIQLDGEET